MATNIDKALNQAPQGIEDLADQSGAEPIEIEIIDPEEVNIHAGDLELSIKPGEDEDEFNKNLAEDMDDAALSSMASDLAGDISQDKASRKDWEKAYTEGIKLLGLQYEDRTEPWDGACGVFHPMITEAVVRFQSETITETFPASGPVRTKILGKETPDIKASARRVEEDLNYELTDVMREFRPEHERMLWSLPSTGSAFKKVYYDPNLGRQTSVFVPAEDIILPYGTTDMDTCYRLTHEMRKTKNDILKMIQAGFYRDIELPDPLKAQQDDIKKAKDKETGFSDLNDDRYTLYEVHVDLDLKGFEDLDDDGEPTGIMLPYVVTLIKGSNDVLSIRRNWKQDDVRQSKRQHFVHYQYIPGFGAYGFGLFHLIGGFAKSATSIIRQLVDAGTLSNLPGGLKTRGLRIKGDDTPIAPGEFRDVDLGSGALKDNILPLPYKEPSQVLAALLDKIVEEGRRMAATGDVKFDDMSANSPVGTTLAILERTLKVMTAVQSRLHYSFKQELRLLVDIIKDYTDPDYDYDPEQGSRKARKEDYSHLDIIPVSDPNAATLSQRVVQYQAVIQMAQMAPDIYDLPQLHRRMLEVLGIKNADKLVPLPDDQKPRDPVSENMSVLKCEPVKAFKYQDHESHIKVHMAASQDPTIMQLIGQNPKAQQIQSSMMAHIAEHVGFAYRMKIEQQLGMPLPPEDEDMPPQIELELSSMMAQAAQQVLQQSKSQAAQQQAQQQQQDPLVQMQQQELKIKQQEVQIKQQDVQAKNQIAQQELQIKAQEMQARQQLEQARLQMDERRMQIDAASKAGQINFDKRKLQVDALSKAGQLNQSRSEDPAITQARAEQEMAMNHQRHQQDLGMQANKQAMAAQQHAQQLEHKQQVHKQQLKQQREAAAQAEQFRNQPKEKPTK
jgi:hypothetical protein